ncbi:MAG: hemin uptake protein HemP [Alphaproteobacteria bacterium]
MAQDNLRKEAAGAGGPAHVTGQVLPRRLDVNDLFADAREIVLVHRGTEYRLRITSNDKLILTK